MYEYLLDEAQLIIDSHHDGVGQSVTLTAEALRQKAMNIAGFEGTKHTEDQWDEWIGKLPVEIRATMIELDDCLDCHDTVRYM